MGRKNNIEESVKIYKRNLEIMEDINSCCGRVNDEYKFVECSMDSEDNEPDKIYVNFIWPIDSYYEYEPSIINI